MVLPVVLPVSPPAIASIISSSGDLSTGFTSILYDVRLSSLSAFRSPSAVVISDWLFTGSPCVSLVIVLLNTYSWQAVMYIIRSSAGSYSPRSRIIDFISDISFATSGATTIPLSSEPPSAGAASSICSAVHLPFLSFLRSIP